MRTIYIAMAGLHGCMPNVCEEFDSYDVAVNFLADLHELEWKHRKELHDNQIIELNIQHDGNEYAEVVIQKNRGGPNGL